MVRDLQPFDFRPADPRYRQMLHATLGIFDAEEAREVELALRLEAAEALGQALGQAGDSRLERDNWVRIEGGGPARLQPYALARYPSPYRNTAASCTLAPTVTSAGGMLSPPLKTQCLQPS